MSNLLIPRRLSREFINAHRQSYNFIYADTIHHDGAGGQATAARGCFNTYPVPVKLMKCYNDEKSFMTDAMYEENCKWILRDIQHVPKDKEIIVFPKIGLGRSELNVRAPRTYEFLRLCLLDLRRIIVNVEDI